MSTIYLKFYPKALVPVACIALRNHPVDRDGTNLLSAECATFNEVEAAANRLKRQIDQVVMKAKTKLH